MENAPGRWPSAPGVNKRRFFEPPTRILIMSAPRTGSTAVMHVLESLGAGHNPEEDLQYHYVAQREITRTNALAHIRKIAFQKGTDAGFFTSKVHFNQLGNLFGLDRRYSDAWIQYFNRFILLRRRDRLAQAISEFFSTRSQVWTLMAETPDQPTNAREFSPEDLVPVTTILSRQMMEEAKWLEIVHNLKLDCLEIFYEDLIASPAGVTQRIADYIGIKLPGDFAAGLRTRKVSDTSSVEKFRTAYLEELAKKD